MRVTIFILSILLFSFGAFLSYIDKTSSATITYTAAIFCLIFAFLQEFKKFKGFGVEAELLEKKIEEADNVVKRLRSLIKPISELLFIMVGRGGRWDSAIPRKDSYRLMTQFTSELKELGISDQEIVQAKSDWHRFNIIDLSRPIIQKIANFLNKKIDAQNKVTQSFKSAISTEVQLAHRDSIEKVSKMRQEEKKYHRLYKLDNMYSIHKTIIENLNDSSFIDEDERKIIANELAEELLDLEYYCKYSDFRRLDVWLEGEIQK